MAATSFNSSKLQGDIPTLRSNIRSRKYRQDIDKITKLAASLVAGGSRLGSRGKKSKIRYRIGIVAVY